MKTDRIPAATYRFQFHHGFSFSQAWSLAIYLHELGISDIYASPLFKARKGSLHGYSVTNPLELNPEVGSKKTFDNLVRKLKSRQMGLVLDMVPNHMAISAENPWWMDVLEDGPGSPYAVFFDIDWHPPQRMLQGKVLIPVLGKPYGEALENQELVVKLHKDGFAVHYWDHKFPLDPKSYTMILKHRLDELEQNLGSGNPAFLGLAGIITLTEHLPPRTGVSLKRLRERQKTKEIIKERLWLLYQGSPEIKEFLDRNIAIFKGKKGDPASFELLDNLLTEQAYRLAHWQVSLEVINYRRFFSINDLISIRIEDPAVFEATHSLLVKLAADDKISGTRIDHIDGLYDPQGYLELLQSRLTPKNKKNSVEGGAYVVVEKILEAGEKLPEDWPVAGTTGYDFLDMAGGLFVDPQGFERLKQIYEDFTGKVTDYHALVYDKKKFIMISLFGGEIESLGHQLGLLAEEDRYAKDVHQSSLTKCLFELTACLPVYRTYIRNYEVSDRDRAYLEQALQEARQRNPGLDPEAFNFLNRVLTLQFPFNFTEEKKQGWLRFVMRWQQFTGPIMAKGQEDTALYIYNPLVSLNEVGTSLKPVSVAQFHSFNQERLEKWPHTLNATSTHDTKRSEDVRLRIHALSEMPEEWEACLNRWRRQNQRHKTELNGQEAPDANDEVLLYQTLLGMWPLWKEEMAEVESRLEAYLIKAVREAKVKSNWIAPNQDYENALTDFAAKIVQPGKDNKFLPDFLAFQSRLAYIGALNSLSQVLLKITSPGVPDFYQGTELWDLSLVDPDNRRPVDFQKRRSFLDELIRADEHNGPDFLKDLLSNWQDGRIKLYLTVKALNFRRNHLDLFQKGNYIPVDAAGPQKGKVVAFARRLEDAWILAAAPRLVSDLVKRNKAPLGPKVWGETALSLPQQAPDAWHNVLTGEVVEVSRKGGAGALALGDVFASFPTALLFSVPASKAD
ncbi:MAG: malto-oligosyltrehalose synthase [Deltaproteobacteria bacterium]|nr:malto-oligosyltrehalose synthase [Deltaproteobacteria bacterium]